MWRERSPTVQQCIYLSNLFSLTPIKWSVSAVKVADSTVPYFLAVAIIILSRFTWFYPLRAKSEFFDVFVRFQNFVETQFSVKLKQFQSDGGTEFTNRRLQSHFSNCGIHHLISCPYTPAQNGRAERKHRHITETGLALLFHSSVPLHFWVAAFSTAVYIINRLPTPLLGQKSPFELVYGRAPAYDVFHIFGCRVYPCLLDYVPNKLAPRSVPCVFLGYSTQHKSYMCLDPTSSRVYVSRHAVFDEDCFPFAKNSTSHHMSDLSISEFTELSSSTTGRDTSELLSHSPNASVSDSAAPCHLCSNIPPSPQDAPITQEPTLQHSSPPSSSSSASPPPPVRQVEHDQKQQARTVVKSSRVGTLPARSCTPR